MTARARTVAIATALAAGGACTPGPVDVATIAPNSLASQMVGHWALDEMAGATAHDTSGNLRDGAVFSTAPPGPGPGLSWTWAPGRFGGALHLTGSDQVTVGSPPFPQATASYTVAAWLFVQPVDFEPPIGAIVSTESPFGLGWSMNLVLPNPGMPGPATYSFGYWIGPQPGDFATVRCSCFVWTEWVHVAAVLDLPSSSLVLYIDGVERDRLTTTTPIMPHQGTLYLGRWGSSASGTRQIAGTIYDVVIYSRALVGEEIALLATAPAPNPM
jgi:hypothetical protein